MEPATKVGDLDLGKSISKYTKAKVEKDRYAPLGAKGVQGLGQVPKTEVLEADRFEGVQRS